MKEGVHTFKERVILLCQSILETRRISHLPGSAHFTIPLNLNPTKWSDSLKQFFGNLATNCVSVFHHFVNRRLNG